MYKKHLLLLTAFTILLFSCKKDDNKPFYSGTWKFVGGAAGFSTTYIDAPPTTYSDSTVQMYSSITSPVKGTINITSSTWQITELSYNLDYKVNRFFYKNGYIFTVAPEAGFFTIPAFSGSMEYKAITADSVYFTAGEFHYPDFSEPLPVHDARARISISGDTMYVHIAIDNYTGNGPYASTHGGRLEKVLKYVR